MVVISIVVIIIFWQVHDLLVNVVKVGGKGFNVPGTSFPKLLFLRWKLPHPVNSYTRLKDLQFESGRPVLEISRLQLGKETISTDSNSDGYPQ